MGLFLPAATPGATPSPSPMINLNTSEALLLILLAGFGLFVMVLVPLALDARRSHDRLTEGRQKFLQSALEKASLDDLTVDELRLIVQEYDAPPTGIKGLARALMAFFVLGMVFVALLVLLVSKASGAVELVKQIITALLSVLATIVGFYFGSRTAETAAEAAVEKALPPSDAGKEEKPGTAPEIPKKQAR